MLVILDINFMAMENKILRTVAKHIEAVVLPDVAVFQVGRYISCRGTSF